MTTDKKSKQFLKKVAKDNDLKCSVTDRHCAFGYDLDDVKNNIQKCKECKVNTVSIENEPFYIKEYMFYAALGMGGEQDDWLDNATGLASIRFCLVEDSMIESTVVISDIFQEEMVESILLYEVLVEILGLDTEVEDFDDVDYDTVRKLVDSMTLADLVCIYYTIAKRHWED